jgi:hypothetical protein
MTYETEEKQTYENDHGVTRVTCLLTTRTVAHVSIVSFDVSHLDRLKGQADYLADNLNPKNETALLYSSFNHLKIHCMSIRRCQQHVSPPTLPSQDIPPDKSPYLIFIPLFDILVINLCYILCRSHAYARHRLGKNIKELVF